MQFLLRYIGSLTDLDRLNFKCNVPTSVIISLSYCSRCDWSILAGCIVPPKFKVLVVKMFCNLSLSVLHFYSKGKFITFFHFKLCIKRDNDLTTISN